MPVEQNREVHIITYYKKLNMEIKVHEHNSNHPSGFLLRSWTFISIFRGAVMSLIKIRANIN